MSYASKELIERAVALVGRTVTYETINEYHAYHDVIEDLARDLAKATPLPTDAEHKAAIDAHLADLGIPLEYTNVFWGGRSEIKPSEISPKVYREFHDKWKEAGQVL